MKFFNILPAILMAALLAAPTQANKAQDQEKLDLQEQGADNIKLLERFFGKKEETKAEAKKDDTKFDPVEVAKRKYNLVTALGDVEGKWDFVENFIANSEYITLDKDGRFQFKNKDDKYSRFVYLGDAIDGGPNNIQILTALVDFKQRHPSRVFLIIGNREANKLRFNWELADLGLDLDLKEIQAANSKFLYLYRFPEVAEAFDDFIKGTGYRTKEGPQEYHYGKDPAHLDQDRLTKAQFITQDTMAAGNLVKFIREELEKRYNKKGDKEVANYLMNFARKPKLTEKIMRFFGRKLGNELYYYLKNAQIAYYDAPTKAFFSHGGAIHKRALGTIPVDPPEVIAEEAITDKASVPRWLTSLNKWAQILIDEGAKIDGTDPKVVEGVMPLVKFQEQSRELAISRDEAGKLKKNAAGAILPFAPGTDLDGNMLDYNSFSVLHGRPWLKGKASMDLFPVDKLIDAAIEFLIGGHSPGGNLPFVMKTKHSKEDKYLTYVDADTTYAKVPTAVPIVVTTEGLDFIVPIVVRKVKGVVGPVPTVRQKNENPNAVDYIVAYNSKDPMLGVFAGEDTVKDDEGAVAGKGNWWWQGLVGLSTEAVKIKEIIKAHERIKLAPPEAEEEKKAPEPMGRKASEQKLRRLKYGHLGRASNNVVVDNPPPIMAQ